MKDLLNSVVFISGAFISNNCWDEWISYFENEGYKCIAPAWPHKDASPEELRNGTADDVMASNTVTSLADHFTSIINALPERPILVGHSLGGVLVQLFIEKELGVAGIAIRSFPPRGVNKFWPAFFKSIWQAIAVLSSSKQTYLISFNKWRYTIANGMAYEQQKELYYQYAIPESKKIIREAFNCAVKINFGKPHAPLLIMSGSNDKLIPASLNYVNYKKYANSNSITEYIEFKGHAHLVFGVPAWKEEADCVLHWLQGLK